MNNEIFSAILMALIVFGAGLYIMDPLMRKKPARAYQDDYLETPMHHLLSRKDSIYSAMKDLEFDYSTGKLSDGDYRDLRAKFTEQASAVLEEIDALADTTKSGRKKGSAKNKKNDAVAGARKCRDCGFAHQEGDRFCQSCGAELG